MKIRTAKKILYSRHWVRKWDTLRPPYYDEDRHYTIPSRSDLPDVKRAMRRIIRYYKHWEERHNDTKR